MTAHETPPVKPKIATSPVATRWFSLRRRLLLPLLAGVSLCWLITLAWSYIDTHHEIDELFDAQLAQTAQSVLALGKSQLEELAEEKKEGDQGIFSSPAVDVIGHGAHLYQRNIMFQLWQGRAPGKLMLRSANAPTTPLTTVEGYSDANNSYADRHTNEATKDTNEDANAPASVRHWRYFSQWDEAHTYRVVVAESHAVRDELIGRIVLRLLIPALFGLPLLGAWVWFATRRGLQPLNAIANQIATREPARLHALTPTEAPEEIRSLIESLNSLFAHVEHTLDNERRFTADAAHELRTPLAALTVQAQVALRSQDNAERTHALEQLQTGAQRAAHLVSQLLTLARIDPETGLHLAPVALDRLAQEVCAAHGAAALDKNIHLTLKTRPTRVSGEADMLRILLRNLIDNAIHYTPAGGEVTVAIADNQLTVSDTGPGIPPHERSEVFRRFYRLAGQSIEGSGLGLSIVARIAQLHGATVELADGQAKARGSKGLTVRVKFAAVC
jgi:signal transduction histidine kinase